MHLYPTTEDHRTMTEFAADADGLVEQLRETGRPVVLTAEGHEVAVLLSLQAFQEMRSAVEQPNLQRAIDEAERGIAEGRWVEHAQVQGKLERWAAGEP